MRASLVLLAGTLALLLARPASAQGSVAGSWITEFPIRLRVINGVESSDGMAQARMTLRLKGDSVLGTWQDITHGASQPARTRALRGTIANGRARVETDPPDERVLRDNDGERRVQMRTRYDFTARGDSLQGTEQSIAADHSSVAHSRPFSAKREAAQQADLPVPPRRVVMPAPVEVPLINAGSDAAPLPAVEVMVNGRGPYRFGIETGANFVVVSRALADSLHLPRAGGADELPEYHADSINVGPASFQDLRVAVLPRPARGVDGLLGLPFYRDLLLVVDYPGQRVRFTRDTLPTADGVTVLPLTRTADFWSVPVSVSGHPLQAILDTRSTGAFAMSPETAAQLPWRAPLAVIGRAGGAGIPTTEVKGGTLEGDIVLGTYHLTEAFVVVHALPPDYPSEPRLGAAALRNFAISLDQSHRRVGFGRTGSTVISLARPAGAGAR